MEQQPKAHVALQHGTVQAELANAAARADVANQASPHAFGNASNDLQRAQVLIEQARDLSDRRRRKAVARHALNLSPDCIEAYLLLAEGTRSPFKAVAFYRLGVEAGERLLGPATFQHAAGLLWELLAARPYLRARAGLAQALWQGGRPEQALRHWHELLKLDRHDHLGIRYLLAARLLELGRPRELEDFLRHHPADAASAYFSWVSALALFRRNGDSAEARQALEAALVSNAQVPVYLLGQQPLPRRRPAFIGRGDASEAAAVAAENLNAWRGTPGALAWLAAYIDAWFR